LYLAYQAARQTNSKNSTAKETGGHLISVSEDGTIAVTNLNSERIKHQRSRF